MDSKEIDELLSTPISLSTMHTATYGEGSVDVDAPFDIDGDFLAAMLEISQGTEVSDRARENLDRKARVKEQRRPSEVKVKVLTADEAVDINHAMRRAKFNTEHVFEDGSEVQTERELIILGRMEVLNSQAKNKVPVYVLYRLDGNTVICPKCTTRSGLSDMLEIAGYKASYPEFDSCPFCTGLLPFGATPEARQAAQERCESQPQYDEETGQLLSCGGKGYLTNWKQAWAYHTCTACTNELRAGGRGGRGRSVKYT